MPAPVGAAEGRIALVRGVADRLDIPLETLDLRSDFELRVITPFVAAYMRGLTPNPCVICNETIKFEHLLRYALNRGIDAVSTGHYVRMEKSRQGSGRALLRGRDPLRDQSYFLHRLKKPVVSRAMFPLGELTKEEVRKLARKMALPASSAPESREICFIPDNDYRRFIESRRDPGVGREGPIRDTNGGIVGEHAGVCRFTIGQRHGLRIASARPYYVKEIRPESHEIVVGRKEDLFSEAVDAEDVTWVEGIPPGDGVEVLAQVRYRQRAAAARLRLISPNRIRLEFHGPQWAVAPGQALVCYDGDRLLGGGWICRERSRS